MPAKLKLASFILLSLITIPLQTVILVFTKGRAAYFLPQLWHRIMTRIFGLKLEIVGRPVSEGQIFFVGNHLSHFDIFIIGGLVPGSFIAKEDLSQMPFVNLLCWLHQTALISRSSGKANAVTRDVRKLIEKGSNVILFPEGTTTRGETVLDFKSSLFSLPLLFADKGLRIQPFTLKLLSVDGKHPDTEEIRDVYAWDRDNPIELAPHIINFAETSGAELQVIFHDPVTIDPNEDRKSLARRIHEIVAAPLQMSVEQTVPAV